MYKIWRTLTLCNRSLEEGMSTLQWIVALLAITAYFAVGFVSPKDDLCLSRRDAVGALLGKKVSTKFQFPLPAEPCESVLSSDGVEEGKEVRREGIKVSKERAAHILKQREEQLLRISELMVKFEHKTRDLQNDLEAAIAENELRRARNEERLLEQERGELESIPVSKDISSLTVVQLRLRCRELGLPVSGTKAALLERVSGGGTTPSDEGGGDGGEATPPAAAATVTATATIEACKS